MVRGEDVSRVLFMAHSCRSRSDRPVASGLHRPHLRQGRNQITKGCGNTPGLRRKIAVASFWSFARGPENSRSHTVVKRARIEDAAGGLDCSRITFAATVSRPTRRIGICLSR